MEPLFGHDFGRVRVHADQRAAHWCERLGAQAFTVGPHIFLPTERYRPWTSEGHALLSHELAHVVQQQGARGARPLLNRPGDAAETAANRATAGVEPPTPDRGPAQAICLLAGPVPLIQRRLLANGTAADIEELMLLLEPAIGQDLEHDPATGEITAIASLVTPATSPSAETIITGIINDPVQDAELDVSQGQPNVAGGAFPTPDDLTAGMVQRVDIDDILAIEAGAPGHGLAVLVHEIQENHHAHGLVPVAGVSRFGESHAAASEAQSDVAEDVIGPGRRVAFRRVPLAAGNVRVIYDFETYYLVYDRTLNAATGSWDISNSRTPARINVSSYDIDDFANNNDAVPASGAADIAAAAADLAANPTATVRVEGFTDDIGGAASNIGLGRRRAEAVRDAIIAAGAAGGTDRFNAVGIGEANPAVPNTGPANRARNRRVVIIIDRPDI